MACKPVSEVLDDLECLVLAKPPGGDQTLYAAWRELHGKGVEGVKREGHAPEPGSLGGVVVHQLGRMSRPRGDRPT